MNLFATKSIDSLLAEAEGDEGMIADAERATLAFGLAAVYDRSLRRRILDWGATYEEARAAAGR